MFFLGGGKFLLLFFSGFIFSVGLVGQACRFFAHPCFLSEVLSLG